VLFFVVFVVVLSERGGEGKKEEVQKTLQVETSKDSISVILYGQS
jgi:hypothetical protein